MSPKVFLRAFLMAFSTLSSYVALLLIWPLRHCTPRSWLEVRNRIFRWWGHSLGRVMGMRMVVEGEPPPPGSFLVSNHLSYADVLLLGTVVDAAFIAKLELRHWPILGPVLGAADTIFIDRSRRRDVLRVLKHIDSAFASGLSVVLFPEAGTGPGDDLRPFKPSVLEFAAASNHPVYWATLTYRTPDGAPPAKDAVVWWGEVGFMTHFFNLLRLPHFEAVMRFGREPVRSTDRKELAAKLRSAMARSFTPVE